MHVFSKKRREDIRKIARQEYLAACEFHRDFGKSKDKIATMSYRNARRRLSRESQYGGLLHSFLLSIAARLVFALIEKWISENLSEVSEHYQRGEPGYE